MGAAKYLNTPLSLSGTAPQNAVSLHMSLHEITLEFLKCKWAQNRHALSLLP